MESRNIDRRKEALRLARSAKRIMVAVKSPSGNDVDYRRVFKNDFLEFLAMQDADEFDLYHISSVSWCLLDGVFYWD